SLRVKSTHDSIARAQVDDIRPPTNSASWAPHASWTSRGTYNRPTCQRRPHTPPSGHCMRPGPRVAHTIGPHASRAQSPARSSSTAAPCTTHQRIDRAIRHGSPPCARRGGQPDSPNGDNNPGRRTTKHSESSWYPGETRSQDHRTERVGDRAI